MSLPPPRHEAFKRRLRLAIRDSGMSIYALARVLDPENPDRAERNLYRWLSPDSTHLPSKASREALARALDKDADFFSPSLGVDDLVEIERLYEIARLHEEAVTRRVWITGPDGRFLEDLRPSRRSGSTVIA